MPPLITLSEVLKTYRNKWSIGKAEDFTLCSTGQKAKEDKSEDLDSSHMIDADSIHIANLNPYSAQVTVLEPWWAR